MFDKKVTIKRVTKMHKKKQLFLSALVSALCITPLTSKADTVNVEATLEARASLSVTKNNDMSFGTINYDAEHAGIIQLATDGSVSLAEASGLSISGGTPSAGDVTVVGDNQSVVEISCEASGALSDGGAVTLPLRNSEFTLNTGTTFGDGTACTGLGAASSIHDFSQTPSAKILMGAEIEIAQNAITGPSVFSTSNGGGDPITLEIIYQ